MQPLLLTLSDSHIKNKARFQTPGRKDWRGNEITPPETWADAVYVDRDNKEYPAWIQYLNPLSKVNGPRLLCERIKDGYGRPVLQPIGFLSSSDVDEKRNGYVAAIEGGRVVWHKANQPFPAKLPANQRWYKCLCIKPNTGINEIGAHNDPDTEPELTNVKLPVVDLMIDFTDEFGTERLISKDGVRHISSAVFGPGIPIIPHYYEIDAEPVAAAPTPAEPAIKTKGK